MADFVYFENIAIRVSKIIGVSIPDDDNTVVRIFCEGPITYNLKHRSKEKAEMVYRDTMRRIDSGNLL